MKDNEIIKALVHRADYDCDRCCDKGENCEGENCEKIIAKSILDLINHQNAEIERLQKTQDDIDDFARDLCKERLLKGKVIANFEDLQEYVRKEKSEAIKEFAVRVKMEVYFILLYYKLDKIVPTLDHEIFASFEKIEKEMTEEDEDNA